MLGVPVDRLGRGCLDHMQAMVSAQSVKVLPGQAALLDSEARFRQLADSMPQIVWTARPDGFIDYYNERWYEFTGFARDAFGDASWEPILDPEDLERTRSKYYTAIQSGEAYNIEYRLWDRQEGRFRWFVGRALPIRDRDGRIVKWFGTCTDIDEQKRVQEELQRANEDLEQFAYSASHDFPEPLRSVKITANCSPSVTGRNSTPMPGNSGTTYAVERAGWKRCSAIF